MAHRSVNKRMAAAACRAYLEKKLQTNAQHVRIYTDASYNQKRCIGAIAYIAVNNRDEVLLRSTKLVPKKESKKNCTYLELLAIREAVLSYKEKFENSDSLCVISDCKTLVEQLNKKTHSKKQRFKEVFDELFAVENVDYIYTKGHATGAARKNIHAIYNRKVDMMCRRKVKNKVKQIVVSQNYDNIRPNVVVNSQ